MKESPTLPRIVFPPATTGATSMLLKVENMSCQHCVRSVTAALRALDAEARVDVDLARGEVRAQGGFTPQAAMEALADADYPAQLVAADD